jgi:hypothetical protein
MPYPSGGEGSYYIVVRHRNHLAIMSAEAISLSAGSSTLYDFTDNQNKAYGTNPMKELGTGVYGMIAGDPSGDGEINANDRVVVWNLRDQTGYMAEDVNLDMDVNAGDRVTLWNNRDSSSQVP